jgi:hypothetical protein
LLLRIQSVVRRFLFYSGYIAKACIDYNPWAVAVQSR